MTTTREQRGLLEEIAAIAKFSYEPAIAKYPYVKTHLSKSDSPKDDWVLFVTTAGCAYALITNEGYTNGNEELNRAIESIGLYDAVAKAFSFLQTIHDTNEKWFRYGMGLWVWRNITNDKPTLEQMDEVILDIGKLLDGTITAYEERRKKEM